MSNDWLGFGGTVLSRIEKNFQKVLHTLEDFINSNDSVNNNSLSYFLI